MSPEIPVAQALPALLSTQLAAAGVYSSFLEYSRGDETALWKKLLADELEHVAHLQKLLFSPLPEELTFPGINVRKMRKVCEQVEENGRELFLLRIEGALRLECAELDYGLEGLVARKMEKSHVIPGYTGDVLEHITFLLNYASRYSESVNIGRQMQRLGELFETSVKHSTGIVNADKVNDFKNL